MYLTILAPPALLVCSALKFKLTKCEQIGPRKLIYCTARHSRERDMARKHVYKHCCFIVSRGPAMGREDARVLEAQMD